MNMRVYLWDCQKECYETEEINALIMLVEMTAVIGSYIIALKSKAILFKPIS